MSTNKKNLLYGFAFVVLVACLLYNSYKQNYLPLKDSNKWTAGQVFKKSIVAKSSKYLHFKYCVEGECYESRENVLTYNHIILDSAKYIVAYYSADPTICKLLDNLPSVEAELGDDLDSLKSKYEHEFNFWKDF